jgi:hypothetical protein
VIVLKPLVAPVNYDFSVLKVAGVRMDWKQDLIDAEVPP